jgi:hypothetical protein
MRRTLTAVAVSLVLAGSGVTACSRTPRPPSGLPTCGTVPTGEDADVTVVVSAPKRSAADGELDATVTVKPAHEDAAPVRFEGGIPVRLLVLAHDDIVGTYEGPTAGVSVDETLPAAGLPFPIHGAEITACSDTVGSTALPAGHYQLVATILRSVDGTAHELVSGRRSIELTI